MQCNRKYIVQREKRLTGAISSGTHRETSLPLKSKSRVMRMIPSTYINLTNSITVHWRVGPYVTFAKACLETRQVTARLPLIFWISESMKRKGGRKRGCSCTRLVNINLKIHRKEIRLLCSHVTKIKSWRLSLIKTSTYASDRPILDQTYLARWLSLR